MSTTDTFDLPQETSELMRDEGTVLYVYDDANGKPIVSGYTLIGNPTIGTGRNLAKGSTGISMAENFLLLGNDISDAARGLDADPMWAGWWRGSLSPIRQRGLLNLRFNMGQATLDEFKRLCAAMKAGDWAEAGVQLRNSRWWNQVGARAERVFQMIVNDALPSDEPPPAALMAPGTDPAAVAPDKS